MRYLALACDYDGTLATAGQVTQATLAALERLLASGRKLLLVSGRELDDLLRVFPYTHLFERVVAENGALLYRPASRESVLLGDAPPAEFIQALRARGIAPLAIGRVIVATRQPHENTVLEVIRDCGLELQVIFNKGAVMVLPGGINKATGLSAALRDMGLSPHNVVGVGDAENDHAFLRLCECSVAVAGALDMLQEHADIVTAADNGAGVSELIDALVANDLDVYEPRLTRHHILLGTRQDGTEVRVRPYGINLLLAGTSGSGKSTLATGFLERLAEAGYQFCVIDPEGDYENCAAAVVLGDDKRAPSVAEALQLIEYPEQNAVINLLGLALEDRPAFFAEFLPRLQALRVQTGRPHWVVVDEAHHLLPASWNPAGQVLTQELTGMLLITVHPDQVAPAVLSCVHAVLAIGESPVATLQAFSTAPGQRPPAMLPVFLPPGEALLWSKQPEARVEQFRIAPSRATRTRHRRKYALGDLGTDNSFYFRGPAGQLNLRAQNLMLFMQTAEGVDDATWLHHLRRGDYSDWFREAIKDEDLAAAARAIERQTRSPRLRAGSVSRKSFSSAIPSPPSRQPLGKAVTGRGTPRSKPVRIRCLQANSMAMPPVSF
jgi:HAD superfamily hydrolase (TIGR01484 family)